MFAHMLVLGLLSAGARNGPWPRRRPPATAKPIKMVVLGDSLSAGLGLSAPAAFPARLQKALQAKGIAVDMINAGVSGDTTSGGRDRLDWSVPEGTEAVIVELGANDALRGVDPKVTRSALTDILTRLKAREIAVLLCGMYAPPNYGSRLCGPLQRDLSRSGQVVRRAAVSVFPRRRRDRGQAQSARRPASDRGGHRRHRQKHPAHGGGISGRDIRATQLKNRQR